MYYGIAENTTANGKVMLHECVGNTRSEVYNRLRSYNADQETIRKIDNVSSGKEVAPLPI